METLRGLNSGKSVEAEDDFNELIINCVPFFGNNKKGYQIPSRRRVYYRFRRSADVVLGARVNPPATVDDEIDSGQK